MSALDILELQRLDACLDEQWHVIAQDLSRIERLSEDPNFPARDLACSIASKVFPTLFSPSAPKLIFF